MTMRDLREPVGQIVGRFGGDRGQGLGDRAGGIAEGEAHALGPWVDGQDPHYGLGLGEAVGAGDAVGWVVVVPDWTT